MSLTVEPCHSSAAGWCAWDADGLLHRRPNTDHGISFQSPTGSLPAPRAATARQHLADPLRRRLVLHDNAQPRRPCFHYWCGTSLESCCRGLSWGTADAACFCACCRVESCLGLDTELIDPLSRCDEFVRDSRHIRYIET